MKMITCAVAAIAMLFLCQSCSKKTDQNIIVEHIEDVSRDVDWSTMETVTISFNEYTEGLSGVILRKGMPYKLELENHSLKAHNIVGSDFFAAIMPWKIETIDGEINVAEFNTFQIYPGRCIDLFFVPTKTGDYTISYNTTDDDAQQGTITIQ
ncbi:MAG: hypothetical protein HN411_03800 [Waddliaceae bacterium]|jgi:hypothetical protein|nr:hypothetical protein [Waddliaceae bacterium]MBT3579230.1 hypothetical protein [Waddliaceae bacterium]MBT4444472.1 hypothetical protein [Waddliaceae bacterium]MBT6928929.1 hypothetical protein [Waddliaceae bacterium]MBT7264176.1 hypothetical protein [Waddliaceae bacterium]